MASRRFLGLLTWLLVLHLTLVRSDTVCAEHGVGGAHAAQTPADAHDQEHHAVTTGSTGGAEDTPCQVPTRPQCCEALASCTTSLVASRGSSRLDAYDRGLVILVAGTPIPASQAAGPEPPPPRA
jgi:hypothetical protein